MAPDETRHTSFPAFLKSARILASFSTLPMLSNPVSAYIRDDEPILTTILFLSFNLALTSDIYFSLWQKIIVNDYSIIY